MEFNITVNGDKIKIDKPVKVAHTGNVNTYRCNFAFSDEWSGLSSFLVSFVGGVYYTTPIVDNTCILPQEVCLRPGYAALGVFGTNGSETDFRRISTGLKTFYIEEGAYRNGELSLKEPEPDLWETLVNKNIPKIGENGNWYVYDIQKGEYIDSGSSSKGADGNTPQKGTDYWTEEDKAEILESVAEVFESEIANKVGLQRLIISTPVDALYNSISDIPELNSLYTAGIYKLFHEFINPNNTYNPSTTEETYCIVSHSEFEGMTQQTLFTYAGIYTRTSYGISGDWTDWTKLSTLGEVDLTKYATKAELGDIETALDNIIAKYGLGGVSL